MRLVDGGLAAVQTMARSDKEFEAAVAMSAAAADACKPARERRSGIR